MYELLWAKIRTEIAAITVAGQRRERDGLIHHPRSFEYRAVESRRTGRNDLKRRFEDEGRKKLGRNKRRPRGKGDWYTNRTEPNRSEQRGRKPVAEEVNTRR